MADYKDVKTMLSTLDGITYTRNNSKQDDGTDILSNTGIDWFKFHNIVPTNIYVNGNGYIGFGSDSEHLRINMRDQAMYYLGYETGEIGYVFKYKYYRIYWKGVSNYNSPQTTANTLEFDTVLMEDGDEYIDIFINIRTFPTNNVSNDNTILFKYPNYNRRVSLGTLTTGSQLSLLSPDKNGNTFNIYSGIIEPLQPEVRYLFGDSNNKVYTVIDGVLSEVTDELTGDVFLEQGTETISSEAIKTLQGLKVYKWQDEGETKLKLKVNATPPPPPQYVSCVAEMSNSSILGIRSISYDASEDVTVTYSFDGTTWSTEKPLEQLTVDDLSGWADTKTIYFKFKLSTSNSRLARFKLIYMN